MILPDKFNIFGLPVPSLLLFILAAFAAFSFVLWRLGKKDGFDEEQLFDTAFLLSFTFSLSAWYPIYYVIALDVLVIFLLPRLLRWSAFRLLDIVSLAFLTGIVPLLIFFALNELEYSIIFFAFEALMVFFILNRLRNRFLKSGYTFSIVLLLGIVTGFLLFRDIPQLLFYAFLFIISLLNIYLREQKNMDKNIFSEKFLNRIKNRLLHKRNRLKNEQKVLLQEDPFMNSDRTRDNAEAMDEAILEDSAGELIRNRQNVVTQMQVQVRKALARIKLGKYGYCEVCGKPIDKARLEAYPEATTCLEHAPKE
jgi:RNA polymerase-binding transcription factor DksA